MTNEEIRDKINFNNKKIESLFNPGIFTLNKQIQELISENDELRKSCRHQFENGVCIYCAKKDD